MTEAQELMLAVCFGSFLGIQVFNIGFIIKFVIDTIKEKLLGSCIAFALVSTVSSRLHEFYGVAIHPYVSSVTSYPHSENSSPTL